MQCEQAQNNFSDYVSGNIDRAFTVTLENHLAGCERCREEVAGLRRIWGALDELPAAEPPLFFHENIMSRLEAERAQVAETAAHRRAAWDWRSLFRPRSLAFAATLLVVVLAGAHMAVPASMDPLSGLIRLLHPAPPPVVILQTARADWMPSPQGGGVLVIHLRAVQAADGHTNSLKYQTSIAGHKSDLGAVTSDQETVVNVPLAEAPTSADVLTVTISPADGDSSAAQKTVTIPITVLNPAASTAPTDVNGNLATPPGQ